jgi:putative PIN family toxin of toxin-antitoxin system
LVQIFIDEGGEAELERALAYRFGKHSIDAEKQKACMAECRKISKKIIAAAASPEMPRCRDPDDQKFLEVALAARADFLVTKDRALLDLARAVEKRALPFRIVRPRALPSARASS